MSVDLVTRHSGPTGPTLWFGLQRQHSTQSPTVPCVQATFSNIRGCIETMLVDLSLICRVSPLLLGRVCEAAQKIDVGSLVRCLFHPLEPAMLHQACAS